MILNEFHFIRPYWLLALLPLLLVIILSFKNKLQQGSWQAVCDAELLPFVLQDKDIKQSRVPLLTGSLAAMLSVIALAGPTWQRLPTPVFRNAAALVIALDLSRSMDASDIKPSRLERARYKISDLLAKRKDGQTALLVYANSAFTVTPLTDDTETINSQLAALTSDIMPAQGSRSDLAINKAVELFKNAGLQKGQILLITDDDNIAQSFERVELPRAYQLSILGVGTQEGAPIKLAQGGFLKDANGNIVLAKLNNQALLKVSREGGGIYQQITDSDMDIERLSQHFDQTGKRSEALENDLLLENWVEAGVWLLFPILFLSAFSFRRGLLSLLFIFLLPLPENSYAFAWQDLWQTKEQQAQQHYLEGNYQEAAQQFQDPAWQAAAQYKANIKVPEDETMVPATTATGHYNQANVLAKSGQLEKAIAAYDQALKLNSDNKDAAYNKAIVEKELEKQKQQQNQENNKEQNKDQKEQDKGQSGDQQDQQGDQSKNESEQNGQQGEQSENKADQQDSDNTPEQQDAKPGEQNEPATDKEADSTNEPKNAETTEQEKPEEAQDSEAQLASEADAEQSEQQQANEQWLMRIPEDPSGLLKRKFKYQYSRQKQRQNSSEQW